MNNGGSKNGFSKDMLRVCQRLRQFVIGSLRETILFDQVNQFGKAYGRNRNLVSCGRSFIDEGFGGG